MPPKDEKRKDRVSATIDDVLRVPLPSMILPALTAKGTITPHIKSALFPEWDADALVTEDWHDSNTPFVDEDFGSDALPPWLSDCKPTAWVRAFGFLSNDKSTENNDHKDRPKAIISENDIDAGISLPRVVVLPSGTEWPPSFSLPLDRGFARLARVSPSSNAMSHQGDDIPMNCRQQKHDTSSEFDAVGASILRLVSKYACDDCMNTDISIRAFSGLAMRRCNSA